LNNISCEKLKKKQKKTRKLKNVLQQQQEDCGVQNTHREQGPLLKILTLFLNGIFNGRLKEKTTRKLKKRWAKKSALKNKIKKISKVSKPFQKFSLE